MDAWVREFFTRCGPSTIFAALYTQRGWSLDCLADHGISQHPKFSLTLFHPEGKTPQCCVGMRRMATELSDSLVQLALDVFAPPPAGHFFMVAAEQAVPADQ